MGSATLIGMVGRHPSRIDGTAEPNQSELLRSKDGGTQMSRNAHTEDDDRFGPPPTRRVWTIPNLISFLRIASIPLIAWLVCTSVPEHRDRLIWALVILALSGASDGVDGYIARRFNQVTVLGQILDPIADRLLIICSSVALCVSTIIPWWMMALILARDAFLLVLTLVIAQYGYGPLPVHFVGKTGTFLIMTAIPVLIVSNIGIPGFWYYVIHSFGLALFWWGIGLYWLAGIIYTLQAVKLLKHDRALRSETAR